jgi:hypothetical protein
MILMTVGLKVKQTLASLKGVESTLGIYLSQSGSKEEVEAYKEAMKETSNIIKDLETRVAEIEYEEPQYKG